MKQSRLAMGIHACLVAACAGGEDGQTATAGITATYPLPTSASASATGDSPTGGESGDVSGGTSNASSGATDGPGGSPGDSGESATAGTTTGPATPATTVDTAPTTTGIDTTGMDVTGDQEPGGAPDSTSTGDAPDGGLAPPGTPTDPELLVALVGDQGSGSGAKQVYQLIKAEKADMLILLGDFDYGDDPDGWSAMMQAELGGEFPVFAAIGNHDVQAWSGYQSILKDRLGKIPGATCTGEYGVMASCNYRGLHFILSGIGTKGKDGDHEQFIADTLAADDSLWSLCVWHKNMRDLQAGDKPDDVTWKALQNCQDGGAVVVMGHEHSYARTLTLSAVGDQGNGHGATGVPELMEIEAGKTFSVVSGLGGKSIRAYEAALHKNDTWWATLYTSDYHRRNGAEIDQFEADYGVLFMRFNVGGDPAQAHGYFKNVQGDVVDEFDAVRR